MAPQTLPPDPTPTTPAPEPQPAELLAWIRRQPYPVRPSHLQRAFRSLTWNRACSLLESLEAAGSLLPLREGNAVLAWTPITRSPAHSAGGSLRVASSKDHTREKTRVGASQHTLRPAVRQPGRR